MKLHRANDFILAGYCSLLLFGMILIPAGYSHALQQLEVSSFDYTPFMSSKLIPEKGHGFGVDITAAAFNSVGIEPIFKFSSIKRNIVMMIHGKSIANLGTISHFKEAAKKGDIIGVEIFPVHFIMYYLNSRIGPVRFNRLSDLKSYTIGNVRGSATTKILTSAGLEIDWVSSIELNFRKFFAGRFDLCVSAELTGDDFVKRKYSEKWPEISKIKPPILTVPMSMNFTKSHSELADRFQQGMDIIKANGTFEKILEIYFGKENGLKPN